MCRSAGDVLRARSHLGQRDVEGDAVRVAAGGSSSTGKTDIMSTTYPRCVSLFESENGGSVVGVADVRGGVACPGATESKEELWGGEAKAGKGRAGGALEQ